MIFIIWLHYFRLQVFTINLKSFWVPTKKKIEEIEELKIQNKELTDKLGELIGEKKVPKFRAKKKKISITQNLQLKTEKWTGKRK